MRNSRLFVFAALSGSLWAVGCSPSDQPQVVPAKNGIYTDVQKSLKKAPVSLAETQQERQKAQEDRRLLVQSTPRIDNSLAGSVFVCAEYATPSVFSLSYADKGQVSRVQQSGSSGAFPSSAGMRWNIGSEAGETGRTGFKFDSAKDAVLYRLDRSNGGSAEIFLDEEKRPVMTCFKKLDTSFLWTSRDLLEVSLALAGAWNCEGPLAQMKIGVEGDTVSGLGSGQFFLWKKEGEMRLTLLISSPTSVPGKMEYNRFSELRLRAEEISQGRWSYESLVSAGGLTVDSNGSVVPSKAGLCTKATS